MKSDDSLVVDNFEEFEFVEDFSFLVFGSLARESPDFADEFPVGVPVRHFANDARCASVIAIGWHL